MSNIKTIKRLGNFAVVRDQDGYRVIDRSGNLRGWGPNPDDCLFLMKEKHEQYLEMMKPGEKKS